jgi:L-ascorbate metabolism protein UlaG (beta-lactamase superfamily)
MAVNVLNCKFGFYRHATALISLGDIRLLIDPMYGKEGRLPPVPSVFDFRWNPIKAFPAPFPELREGDIVLITHHHFDHFDRAATVEIDKERPIVSPENGAKRLTRLGFKNIYPLRGGQNITIGAIEIDALPVKHAERCQKLLYKPGLGYLIRREGKTVYISGDTVLFDRLLDRLKGVEINLAVLYGGGARIPLLGRHTFSHEELFDFAKMIQPDRTLVIHLDCLNHCSQTGHHLHKMLKRRSENIAMQIPEPGHEYGF